MTRKQRLQEAILSAMADNGISQSALAKGLGVSRQAVFIALKTDDVGYDKLFELADLVGLEVEFLVRYK
jgi:predicted XRE-type DNA-binding protein